MANYQTHVTVSGGAGIVLAAVAWFLEPSLGWSALGLAVLASYFGGMVPDLDHDTGVALAEISGLLSTFAPVVLLSVLMPDAVPWGPWALLLLLPWHFVLHSIFKKISALQARVGGGAIVRIVLVATILSAAFVFVAPELPFPPEQVLGAMSLCALGAQGGTALFRRLTVHRGIFHSVPAVGIYASLVYLVSRDYTDTERLVIGGGALAGALSHLLLDELWSVDFHGKRLKNSSGTAMSFWKKKTPVISALAWALFFGLACVALLEEDERQTWMQMLNIQALEEVNPTR